MSNMSDRRRCVAAGLSEDPGTCVDISTGRLRTNRLRRLNTKPSQQPPPLDSPNHHLKDISRKWNMCFFEIRCQETEFKITPTRLQRSRYTSESPLSDSDLRLDIIWDATSPTPIRAGKRGKKYSNANVGIRDISEIVNRIAPKHGRPVAPESSLQQWIGDGAIPCTPEVQKPKPKKKPSRQNGVDDLLKLAKQFDFNMKHQDEEEVQNMQEQSVELISDDILDLDDDGNEAAPALNKGVPERAPPALQTTRVSDGTVTLPDQDMEDDLDFLFDGPTQHISGDLSKNSLTLSLEVKSTPSSKDISGKDTNPANGLASHSVKLGSGRDDFDDDWENDDLLDDSLVLEMTQNPHDLAPPRHSSTQRGSNETKSDNNYPATLASNGYQRSQQEHRDIQPAVSTRQENAKIRKTFKLQANPHFQVNGIFTEAEPNKEPVRPGQDRKMQQGQSSSLPTTRVVPSEAGSQRTQPLQHHSSGINSRPTVPQFHQSTQRTTNSNTLVSSNSNTLVSSNSNTCPMTTSQKETNFDKKRIENKTEVKVDTAFGGNSDFPDDDLDSFFASDDLWDDKDVDDDLLCEACDDLESELLRSAETPSIKRSLAADPTHGPTSARAPASGSSSSSYGLNRETRPMEPRHLSGSTYSQSAPRIGGTYIRALPNNGVWSKAPVPVVTGYNTQSVNDMAGKATSSSTVRPQNHTGKEPYPCTQAKSTYGARSATNQQGLRIGIPTTLPPPATENATENSSQFTFKRPSGCVSYPVASSTSKVLAANQAVGKCSAAEIELKKQQAVARRRQRTQTTQNNLRPPS